MHAKILQGRRKLEGKLMQCPASSLPPWRWQASIPCSCAQNLEEKGA